MDDFPRRLRRLREDQKPIKSRYKVSQLCGLPADSIRRYERGEAKPTMEALIKLADYYKVSLDYLAGRVPDR